MNFKQFAKERYSCRKLSDKKIETQKIEEIIETAILSPTAVNYQPYKIFSIESDRAKENLKKTTNYIFGADTFLVVGYDPKLAWVREYDERNFGIVDASIVATHIMFAIKEQGLETTWVGYFDAPLLKKLCPEMKDYELIAIFPIGYPKADAKPSKKHDIRKTKAEILEIL
ncbi:MAG: nitroreductase family protein [Tissierellia bacterium]|nr:nitroreductase family protein [Tissierellia bacterium]